MGIDLFTLAMFIIGGVFVILTGFAVYMACMWFRAKRGESYKSHQIREEKRFLTA